MNKICIASSANTARRLTTGRKGRKCLELKAKMMKATQKEGQERYSFFDRSYACPGVQSP
jgi:hypothetical protein